ncbi:Acetyl-CoA carboxylase 2 [Apodemus speciosus]|uniref:Acetyl-CoA carboxylase 2 n=1 Tax=Apodemus speciosus TaxID=105296 RepID=A0ABQ0ESJ7_APOSI
MVAFKMRFKTPEYPEGRDAIVIGNDITFQIGSSGHRGGLVMACGRPRWP